MMCGDSGRVCVPQEAFGRMYYPSKPCACALEKRRRSLLARIPPGFPAMKLSQIVPRFDKHPNQAIAFQSILDHPSESLFISGRPGCGKTMALYALYREGVMKDERVVVCTLTELLNEHRKVIQDSMAGNNITKPRLCAEDLKQNHTKFQIFFDDLDKARPSEYAAEQLFEILNAAVDFQHRLVVTTNLTLTKLVEHFDRADERFGKAIVRRIAENSIRVEMF